MKQKSLAELKQTAAKVEQGAWVPDNPYLPGLPLKVRAQGNSDYNELYAKLSKEYTPEELKTEEVKTRIDNELLARTVLVDWSIADTPYSVETALEMLADPDWKPFRRAVTYASNNVAEVGVASLEDAVKN